MDSATARFDRFRRDFFGLEREDLCTVVAGDCERRRRVYLDTGATALMPRFLHDALGAYAAEALANSHTSAHRAGRITTREIHHARDAVAQFVSAHPENHVALFAGNGATGALNLLASALFPAEVRLLLRGARTRDPELRGIFGELNDWAKGRGVDAAQILNRNLIVVSPMEHHSNILPWMRAVGSRNVRFPEMTPEGQLRLDDLERILDAEGERVRLVAVTGASNVTGLEPPVREIARMAHRVGAQIVVDAAQWAPHARIKMHDPDDPDGDIDYLAISGHKLYAPGSRGVLVGCRSAFPGPEAVGDVGGGMADVVDYAGYSALPEVTDREEGGTPNLTGTIALGLVVEALSSFGMELVEEHEKELVSRGIAGLSAIPGLEIYGPLDPVTDPRVAVFSFNVGELPHGFVAAALSDYCNVSVRNSSFCAQLYVRHLLGGQQGDLLDRVEGSGCGTLPGMVRASCGIYSTVDDLEALFDGIRFVVKNADAMVANYEVGAGGEFLHRDRPEAPEFSISGGVRHYFDG